MRFWVAQCRPLSEHTWVLFLKHLLIFSDLYEKAVLMSDHERDLLQDYSLKEDFLDDRGQKSQAGSSNTDVYEKAVPKHGDLWFHKFLSVIQKNPGQVVRYERMYLQRFIIG